VESLLGELLAKEKGRKGNAYNNSISLDFKSPVQRLSIADVTFYTSNVLSFLKERPLAAAIEGMNGRGSVNYTRKNKMTQFRKRGDDVPALCS
jgi:hypothetical protein